MTRKIDIRSRSAYLIAGMLSGVSGLAVFLFVHHMLITPIWFIAPAGAVFAGLGGLVVGWSYSHLDSGLPRRPWTGLAWMVLIAALLAPGILLAQTRPALIPNSASLASIDLTSIAIHYAGELLLPAAIVGGLVGWYFGRTRQATFATALAGLLLAIGPGHNIPVLGSTPAVGKELILLLAVTTVSALVLVEVKTWLMNSGQPSQAAAHRGGEAHDVQVKR